MTTDRPNLQPDDDVEGGELFPGPTRTTLVVRHGQYISSGPPDYDGPLTEQGRKQAALLAERLAESTVSAIHCSTLQRARETAAIIATRFPGLEPQASPLLCECVASVPALIKEYLEANVPAHELVEGPIQAREAWQTYFQPPAEGAASDTTEIIVSSGNIIGYFVAQALGAHPDAWMRSDIQHCGLTEIAVKRVRGPVLLRHNDTGHLPPALRTFV